MGLRDQRPRRHGFAAPSDPAMEWLSLVSLLIVLFLVARGTSGSRMLVIVAVTLAVVTVILFAERGGFWPEAFRQP